MCICWPDADWNGLRAEKFCNFGPLKRFFDIMEPFSPQDPLTKLLAQARDIEVRSNFTQNVVRAARQTPQDRGWLAALRGWWEETGWFAPQAKWSFASAVTLMAVVALALLQTPPDTMPQVVEKAVAPVAELPLLPAAETPWETAYQTEALLAVEDTTQFTDSEIGFLLY
jgi:hypothetical protein